MVSQAARSSSVAQSRAKLVHIPRNSVLLPEYATVRVRFSVMPSLCCGGGDAGSRDGTRPARRGGTPQRENRSPGTRHTGVVWLVTARYWSVEAHHFAKLLYRVSRPTGRAASRLVSYWSAHIQLQSTDTAQLMIHLTF
jgi:hypothetical protein